jgi:hypothetical protein
MSTKNISWGIKAAGARLHNLTTFMCQFSRNSESLKLQEPSGPVIVLQRDSFLTKRRYHLFKKGPNVFRKPQIMPLSMLYIVILLSIAYLMRQKRNLLKLVIWNPV